MSFNKSSILVITSFIIVLISLSALFFLKTNPFLKKVDLSLVSDVSSLQNFCISQNCFSKIENIWFINQTIPSDPTQIENFLSKLENIKLDSVLSNNPHNFDSLGISSHLSIPFSIGDSNYQLSSNLLSLSQNLIKPKQKDIVYKIDFIGDPADLVSLEYWLVKYLQNISQYQIKTISITTDNISKTYQADQPNWPNNELLELIAYLKASDYIGTSQPESTNIYQLTSVLENDSQSQITFGKTIDNLYWATSQHGFYYKIDKSIFDKLTTLLK